MRGPLTSIEISDLGDRIGGRIPVTVAATGARILLPARYIEFCPGRVRVPLWLYRKLAPYIKPNPPGGPKPC